MTDQDPGPKYAHTKASSAEFLRLALPLMSRQDAGLHPISYAVWYDYVSGDDQVLRERIDATLGTDGVLSEAATRALYREHIARFDEESARKFGTGIQRVMGQISASASDAGNHAEKFGATLENFAINVSQAPTSQDAQGALHSVLEGTRQMQGAMVDLKERLEESRAEIDVLRREISRAREEALADGLTGLANRRAFDRALSDCMARNAEDLPGPCLVIADIDHFKRVNDTYGHLFGDKVIRAVAQVLKAQAGGRDTVARYGGEEFGIILPDTSLEAARKLAECIRATIERSRIKRTDNEATLAAVTLSLGVAARRSGESISDLVRRADEALYASKNRGRNQVTVAR